MNLELDQLLHVQKLGEGQFGLVNLVCLKSDPQKLFALKTITNNIINEHSIGQNVVNELEVLETINFPYIIKLYKVIKDDKAIHIVMNYVKGIDMFEMLS